MVDECVAEASMSRVLWAGLAWVSCALPLQKMSVLKLACCRRTDDIDKPPLLTLVLDAPSFLTTELSDDRSLAPLYSTTTANMTTTIHRAAPGPTPTKTADIRWPTSPLPKPKGKKAPDGVLLQLPGAAWIPANTFLKPSTSMECASSLFY